MMKKLYWFAVFRSLLSVAFICLLVFLIFTKGLIPEHQMRVSDFETLRANGAAIEDYKKLFEIEYELIGLYKKLATRMTYAAAIIAIGIGISSLYEMYLFKRVDQTGGKG